MVTQMHRSFVSVFGHVPMQIRAGTGKLYGRNLIGEHLFYYAVLGCEAQKQKHHLCLHHPGVFLEHRTGLHDLMIILEYIVTGPRGQDVIINFTYICQPFRSATDVVLLMPTLCSDTCIAFDYR